MNRKAGVILSYILMVFEVASTLLLTPFIIRTLGGAEYGVYTLAANVNAYLMILDLGVGNAVIRFIAKFRANNDLDSAKRFMGVATIYYSAIAVIALVAGTVLVAIFPVAFAKGLSESEILLGQKLLSITMITSALTLGTAPYNNAILAHERFIISKGCSILQILLRIILTFAALKMGLGSIGIVTINLALTVLCRGLFILYTLLKLRLFPKFRGMETSFVKGIVSYSSFILLQMIATQINSSADQILLGAIVPSSAAIIAVYGIGLQVVQYYQTIGSSFNGVLMPGIVKLIEKGSSPSEICDEMVRIGRIILMVLSIIWSGFLLFGEQFICLWAGAENSAAYYVTSILMTAQLFIITESIGAQVLWAKNEHREQSVLKIGIVVLNVFLTVLLIKWRPLLGATIGTFISLILGDILIANIIYKKKIGISLKTYYKGLLNGIGPCIVVSFVAGMLIRMLHLSGVFGFAVNIALTCIIYAVSMWIFGMNEYEKNLLLSTLRIKKH